MNAENRVRQSIFKKRMNYTFMTTFVAAILGIFLIPFLYMIVSSLKTHAQMTALNAPIWPADNPKFVFKGENTGTYTFKVNKSGTLTDMTVNMNDYKGQTLPIYTVPLENGTWCRDSINTRSSWTHKTPRLRRSSGREPTEKAVYIRRFPFPGLSRLPGRTSRMFGIWNFRGVPVRSRCSRLHSGILSSTHLPPP